MTSRPIVARFAMPGVRRGRVLLAAAGLLGAAAVSHVTVAQSSRTIRLAQPVQIAPAAPAAPASGAQPANAMSPEEIAQIKTLYDALDPEEQAELVAAYTARGIDLLALFGGGSGEAGAGDAAAPAAAMPLLQLVQQQDYKRTPALVLAARTRMSQAEMTERPAEDAESTVLAEWLHTRVLAGAWDDFTWFVAERAGDDAEAIYAHVLQSTNQGDPQLLPEEVLAIADAAPAEPTEWQIDILAQLLRTSSRSTSTGPMLAQLRTGTRLFGAEGDERRSRTAALLMKAGMPIEAYDYLPPIADAQAAGDARVIIGHAMYHEGRAAAARGADVEVERRTAFRLYADVALLEDAEVDTRREALDKAMSMLPDIPESIASPWLDAVFEQAALAPAALEIIALDALTLGDRNLGEAQRARAILIMKSAVQTLLAGDRMAAADLRVPLRMLTTGLVTEAEKAVNARPDPRRGNASAEKAMLMRAIPSEDWLATIEPSLAVRAYRAFVGLATVADETDLALDLLAQGIARHPGQAEDLAGDFLAQWTKRLRPSAGSDQNAAMMAAFIIFGGRTSVPAAPLTRGRQARNLERLATVLDLVRDIGLDPRELPNVVEAFRACHSQAEAFTANDIERVLGPIDELPGATAATLADAMRGGLSGDWRNRETQQRFGMRRNASEIAAVVADGYGVAMRLIDRAIAEEPASWNYAITRAALAFDRLEHRRSMQGDDFAEYEQLRQQSFDAFADAAERYAALAADGGIPVTIGVHMAWFNAAVGATQLDQLTRDNILYEGSERDTQIDRIRASLLAMSREQTEAHLSQFVQQIVGGLTSVNPEVKPRLVRHALRVVGDHPLGAPLQRIRAVHEDLIENEIALRVSLDGGDRVGSGAGETFGAVLALRYTNAVDRETDGFAKYLRNQVWVYFGNTGRTVDYRDRLERSIERSLEESFVVESIAFFDPLFPSREVRERGEAGWQEKPLAYLVLSAKDPSIERIPPVQMDLDFVDTTGPVILAIESNAPAVDAQTAPNLRPVRELTVTQTVDARAMGESDAGNAITLEVRATGRGVIPDLEDLLAGLDGAVQGYAIAEDGIERHPMNVLQEDRAVDTPFGLPAAPDPDEEDAELPGPDDDGVYRADFERAWTVRYVPAGGATGRSFTLPTLRDGVDGALVSQHFDDLDVVTVSATSVPIGSDGPSPIGVFAMIAGGLAVLIAVTLIARGSGPRAADDTASDLLAARATPLGTIAALQRIDRTYGAQLGDAGRAELATEIGTLEARYFGRPDGGEAGGDGSPDHDLHAIVERWVGRVRGT